MPPDAPECAESTADASVAETPSEYGQSATAVLEPPKTFERRGPVSPDLATREACKALSIAGLTDNAILEKFHHLKPQTLRKWRERDPVWREMFIATRKPVVTVAEPKPDPSQVAETVTKQAGKLVVGAVSENLASLHASTATRVAQLAHDKIAKFATNAPDLETYTDAATLYKLQRLACGVDKEGATVNVNMTMFSGQDGVTMEGAEGPTWEAEVTEESQESSEGDGE